MAPRKPFSGQLPVMQVDRQQPLDDHSQRPDPAKFRLNLNTFVENRSYSIPATVSTDALVPAASSGHAQPLRPTYKRILFTTANIPGLSTSNQDSAMAERPKRKKRRTTQNSEKTRLRTFKIKSSSSNMHADAWSIILAHTRPSFVMQMRTVSKFFYHITNADTLWRDAREHYFGVDMPARPSFLTERQYASLLDGRGCQNPRCERRETRKVRWVFRLRLCDECLSRKLAVYKHDLAPSPQSRYASMFQTTADREQYGTSIIDLLPTSGTWSGKPNAPRCVGRESGKWLSRSATASPLLYLKSDYAALEDEYKKIQEEDWEPQRVFDWVQEKYRYATMVARTASDLEWWEFRRFSDNLRLGSVRGQRQDYFIQKALQMTPPMSEQLLSCFAAYHTSLASSNPPSERSWDTLLAKILPYRALAQQVVDYLTTRYPRFGQSNIPTTDMSRFEQLHEHRRVKRKELGEWSPEQRFVLDLADMEFSKLLDRVADEDLLLLCLHNVYRAYERSPAKPQGLRADGTVGEYRLSLDDAKLIVEEIIEKRFKRSTRRGVKVLESLRCMGCTRFTSGKRYSFHSAFEHMLEKHARLVGKDLHFHRFLKFSKVPPDCAPKDYKFPWYLVEWTRSLPLLPTHAEVTSETRWTPDEDVAYVQLRRSNAASAFDGRHAVAHEDIMSSDFKVNFVHAAKTLSSTRLDTESVVKAAIQYSTELLGDEEPSIEDFFACMKPAQELGSGLVFKFRCGACNRRPDVNHSLRCVKHAVEMSMLRKHWDDKHAHEGIAWTANLMDLPSDTTLLETMLAHDKKLQKDQADSIKRETIGLKKNAKKVRDQKAPALMQKEMAMEAFGRLFAQVDLT